MAEFEEKLGAILGNEAAMSQIMSLAQSLSGGGEQHTNPVKTEEEKQEYIPVQQSGEGNILDSFQGLDPRMLEMGMRLFGEYQGENNRNLALLTAIRPFLRPERYAKMDKAIQLARLSRVVRVLFQSMAEGREKDV